MTDAPERVWLEWMDEDGYAGHAWEINVGGSLDAEYIRADLVPQWQPIETAPRDGTDFMVWNGEVMTLSTWGKTAHVPIYGWLQIAWADPEDADLMYPQPTHWMPRPNPPPAT